MPPKKNGRYDKYACCAEEAAISAVADQGVNEHNLRNPDNAILFYFLGSLRNTAQDLASEGAGSKVEENLVYNLPRVMFNLKTELARVRTTSQLVAIKNCGPKMAEIVQSVLWSRHPPEEPDAAELEAEEGLAALHAPAKAKAKAKCGPKAKGDKRAADGGSQETAQDGGVDESPPAKKARKVKEPCEPKGYVPRVGTAPYAFLIVLYKEMKAGRPELTKEALMRLVDSSGLSNASVYGNKGAHPGGAGHGRGGAGAEMHYDGWSSMTKTLINKGLVSARSNPKLVKLCMEGIILAANMYKDALMRGKIDADPSIDPDADIEIYRALLPAPQSSQPSQPTAAAGAAAPRATDSCATARRATTTAAAKVSATDGSAGQQTNDGHPCNNPAMATTKPTGSVPSAGMRSSQGVDAGCSGADRQQPSQHSHPAQPKAKPPRHSDVVDLLSDSEEDADGDNEQPDTGTRHATQQSPFGRGLNDTDELSDDGWDDHGYYESPGPRHHCSKRQQSQVNTATGRGLQTQPGKLHPPPQANSAAAAHRGPHPPRAAGAPAVGNSTSRSVELDDLMHLLSGQSNAATSAPAAQAATGAAATGNGTTTARPSSGRRSTAAADAGTAPRPGSRQGAVAGAGVSAAGRPPAGPSATAARAAAVTAGMQQGLGGASAGGSGLYGGEGLARAGSAGLSRQPSLSGSGRSGSFAGGDDMPAPPTGVAQFEWNIPLVRETGSYEQVSMRLPPLPAGVAFETEYEVVLLMDSREQLSARPGGSKALDRAASLNAHMAQVRARGVAADVRHLGIGDALWIARSRRNPGLEYVLDFVVERKSVNDLANSIMDGRYSHQKWWLNRCGLRNTMYLVEGDANGMSFTADATIKRVKTAAAGTEVEGFLVMRTLSVQDTLTWYARLTKAITHTYAGRKATHATVAATAAVGASCVTVAEAELGGAVLEEFGAWNTRVHRIRAAIDVGTVFGLMLCAVPGVLEANAKTVLARYSTAPALWAAYKTSLQMATSQGRDPRSAARAMLQQEVGLGQVLSARIYEQLFRSGVQ